jgi:hypothetical protein
MGDKLRQHGNSFFIFHYMNIIEPPHCKKRLAVFPSPAGMSQTKLSMDGNIQIIPGQGEFG